MVDQQEEMVSALIEQLQSSDRLKRISAARQLVEFEGRARDAIPILRSWIGSKDRYSHVTALGAIIWIDKSELDSLIPLLIEALEFDGLEQWHTILQLQSLGNLALPAVPALKRLLNQHSVVSTSASEAIYELTGDPTDVIDVGLQLLAHPDWLQRWVGIEHLEGLGREAESAIAQLEWVAIEDDDEGVRKRAREAVEEIVAHDRLPPCTDSL